MFPNARNRSGSQGKVMNELRYRIVVLGGTGVGKSSIISQFLYERFNKGYKETIEDLHQQQYELGEYKLTLDILDTSGSREFPAMRRLAIANADSFVLVYSVTDSKSFDEVKKIRGEIIKQRGKVPMVIVGNKADGQTDIMAGDVQSTVCFDWGSGYIQSSAKFNKNIVGIFHELLRMSDLSGSLGVDISRRMSMPVNTPSASKRKCSCNIL